MFVIKVRFPVANMTMSTKRTKLRRIPTTRTGHKRGWWGARGAGNDGDDKEENVKDAEDANEKNEVDKDSNEGEKDKDSHHN